MRSSFRPPPPARPIEWPRKGWPRTTGCRCTRHRLVFVLDTSGSMTGPRMDAAKRELVAAIEALPDYAEFGVVAFNSKVDQWQGKLVPATLAAKKAAARFVAARKAEATTASYDALEAAFRFDAEAIYFLSDGRPKGGKIWRSPKRSSRRSKR